MTEKMVSKNFRSFYAKVKYRVCRVVFAIEMKQTKKLWRSIWQTKMVRFPCWFPMKLINFDDANVRFLVALGSENSSTERACKCAAFYSKLMKSTHTHIHTRTFVELKDSLDRSYPKIPELPRHMYLFLSFLERWRSIGTLAQTITYYV